MKIKLPAVEIEINHKKNNLYDLIKNSSHKEIILFEKSIYEYLLNSEKYEFFTVIEKLLNSEMSMQSKLTSLIIIGMAWLESDLEILSDEIIKNRLKKVKQIIKK